MSRRGKLVAPLLAIAVAVPAVANASTAGPDDDRPPGIGLEAGSWIADSSLSGVSRAVVDGTNMEFTAQFEFEFAFDVDIAGGAAGDWAFTGAGSLELMTPAGPGTLDQDYTGDGNIFTVGDELSFDGTVNRTGVVTAAGREIPIQATEGFGAPMSVDIAGASCEEAWGNTSVSFEEISAEIGWTPTWTGPWFAVRQDTEPDARSELIPGLNQIAADHSNALDGLGVSDIGPDLVPALRNLISRALPILNEIRNLGECARTVFDDSELEWWETVLSTIVRDSILAILSGSEVDGFELLSLVDAGLAANAFGPNLPTPLLTTDALDALRARADEIISGMVIEDGGPLPEGGTCDNAPGCLGVTSWDQLGALVAAKKMGWDVELADGSRRTAEQLIERWAEFGGDVEGAVAENRPDGGEDG